MPRLRRDPGESAPTGRPKSRRREKQPPGRGLPAFHSSRTGARSWAFWGGKPASGLQRITTFDPLPPHARPLGVAGWQPIFRWRTVTECSAVLAARRSRFLRANAWGFATSARAAVRICIPARTAATTIREPTTTAGSPIASVWRTRSDRTAANGSPRPRVAAKAQKTGRDKPGKTWRRCSRSSGAARGAVA